MLFGTGIIGLFISLGVIVLGFVLSAFITALWVRLILVFMRKALDREYGRMRMIGLGFSPGRPPAPAQVAPPMAPGPPMPLRPQDGPRDW